MRSAIIAAAFAASAIAVPYNQQKRDVVTDTDVEVVYVTDVVTVTAGYEPSPAPAAPTSVHEYAPPPHHHHHHHHSSEEKPSTYQPPPPPPSSTSTSEYVAPTTTEAPPPPPTSTYVPPPPPSTTEKPTQPAAPAKPTTYSEIAKYHHNVHRKNHSAPAIEWDQGLADTAQTIAQSCVYAHNVDCNGGGYGQNIAAGVEPNNISAVITDLMYNGEMGWYDGLYGQAQPDMTNFEHWGHFSQIVWKDTTHFGCWTQDCTGQGLANVGSDVAAYFTVCNYKGPGNFANEYGANVLSPLGYPTVGWNAGM